ncbi:AAA family ATPase [Candidatus Parcubacteria bacterium]|nr:AAA family ATPase [Candidatus Parcubacteria bacterium]
MKKKKIIGIIGEQAGGKGAVSNIIRKRYGGTRLTTSDILRRTLDSLYIPSSRENLINLALILKKGFENKILMYAMLRDVENTNDDLIIVDGIRMPGDVEPFKEEYGKDFHLIYITADAKLRYERSLKRGEKAGESDASFDDFTKNGKKETEKHIPKIGKTAEFIIENNDSEEELEEKVFKIMEKI